MSIYIKGMEMPKNCVQCPFNFSTCVSCAKTRNTCPLVPVPPHGRLIDADALDTSILQAGFSYAITRRKLRYTPGDVRQKIANAPTVIEAEEGE